MKRAALLIQAIVLTFAASLCAHGAQSQPAAEKDTQKQRDLATLVEATLREVKPPACDRLVWDALSVDVYADLYAKTEKHYDWAPRYPPVTSPAFPCLEPIIRGKGTLPDWPRTLVPHRETIYRFAVALCLRTSDPRLAFILLDHLEAKEDAVRAVAMNGLGALEERAAVPAIIRLLRSSRLRLAAVAALEQIGDPSALPALREALKSTKDEDFRSYLESAIRTLEAVPPSH